LKVSEKLEFMQSSLLFYAFLVLTMISARLGLVEWPQGPVPSEGFANGLTGNWSTRTDENTASCCAFDSILIHASTINQTPQANVTYTFSSDYLENNSFCKLMNITTSSNFVNHSCEVAEVPAPFTGYIDYTFQFQITNYMIVDSNRLLVMYSPGGIPICEFYAYLNNNTSSSP